MDEYIDTGKSVRLKGKRSVEDHIPVGLWYLKRKRRLLLASSVSLGVCTTHTTFLAKQPIPSLHDCGKKLGSKTQASLNTQKPQGKRIKEEREFRIGLLFKAWPWEDLPYGL